MGCNQVLLIMREMIDVTVDVVSRVLQDVCTKYIQLPRMSNSRSVRELW
jgi:hypothetical protein